MMSRLRLTPYNPDADVRDRAARAVEKVTREHRAIKDPGVKVTDDFEDRMKPARAKWLKTPEGREYLRRQERKKP